MASRGLLLALVLAGSVARAAPHPRVSLELDPCVRARREEVRRVLAIELGALLDEGGEERDRTRVRVGCEGALTTLHIDDPITGKSLDREIDLSAASTGSARLLGLAIAELVTASWSELVENPRPKVPPAGPPPSVIARESARAVLKTTRAPLERLRLTALGLGRGMFAGSGFLGGAGLRLTRYHPRHVGWLVDLEVAHGSASASLGTVSTDLLSIGTAFVAHQSWRKIGIHAGVGLRFGAAHLRGEPSQPGASAGSLWGPWVGPMATLGLVGAPLPRLAIELGLEGGYVVVPIGGLVGERREVAVEGGWIGFQIGVGVFL